MRRSREPTSLQARLYSEGAAQQQECLDAGLQLHLLVGRSLVAQRGFVDDGFVAVLVDGRLVAATAVVLIAAAGVGVVVTRDNSGDSARRQRSRPATADSTTTLPSWPAIDGKTLVRDANGIVGYASTDLVQPSTIAEVRAINARSMAPVTLADGTLVGYFAPSLGFINLSTAQAPGFDIEAMRAQKFGGCEPQIGDPNFKQEYPVCDAG